MYEEGLSSTDVGSAGNMIRPVSPSLDKDLHALVSTTSGALIDLDHTKYTTDTIVPREDAEVPSSDILRLKIEYLGKRRGHNRDCTGID